MKKYFLITLILAAFAVIWTNEIVQATGESLPGEHTEYIRIVQDTMSNNSPSRTIYKSIEDYTKISLYLGGAINDSVAYAFKVYIGSQGQWEKVADDSLKTTTATSGVIATDSKVYTWDISSTVGDTGHVANSNKMKMERLNTDIKVVITKLPTGGNGVGTGYSSKSWLDIFLVGKKYK